MQSFDSISKWLFDILMNLKRILIVRKLSCQKNRDLPYISQETSLTLKISLMLRRWVWLPPRNSEEPTACSFSFYKFRTRQVNIII